jgi:hypothetical protein
VSCHFLGSGGYLIGLLDIKAFKIEVLIFIIYITFYTITLQNEILLSTINHAIARFERYFGERQRKRYPNPNNF